MRGLRKWLPATWLLWAVANPVNAQLAVFDVASWEQSLSDAIQFGTMIEQQASQIRHQYRMIELQMAALDRITDGDFWSLGRDGILGSLRKIDGTIGRVRGVRRRAERIQEDFGVLTEPLRDALESGDEAALSEHEEEVRQLRARMFAWQDDLLAAHQAAVDAERTVEEVEAANAQVIRYLHESEHAPDVASEVRQIQVTNALLGTVSNQLASLQVATTDARMEAARLRTNQAEIEAARQAESAAFFADPNLDDTDGTIFRGGRDN